MIMMSMNPAVKVGHKLARDLRGSEQTLTNNITTTTYLIQRNRVEQVLIHEAIVQPHLASVIRPIVDKGIPVGGGMGSDGSGGRHAI